MKIIFLFDDDTVTKEVDSYVIPRNSELVRFPEGVYVAAGHEYATDLKTVHIYMARRQRS